MVRKRLYFFRTPNQRRDCAARVAMHQHGVSGTFLTSMQAIAYYSGFLYCDLCRPYGLVVTAENSFTILAEIDGGQPKRCCYGGKYHLYGLAAQ